MARYRKQRKHFYAVADGHCPPSIFTSWFQAGPMVNGCPNNTYKGFDKFESAKRWLFEQGHETFYFVVGCSDGPKSRTDTSENGNEGHPEWYAVANGQSPGIYSTYHIAKLQVEGYSSAIFKSYATEEAARAALEGAAEHLRLNQEAGMSISSEERQIENVDRIAEGLSSMSLGS